MLIHVGVVGCGIVDVGRLTEYWGDVGSMKVDGMSTILQSTDSLDSCASLLSSIIDMKIQQLIISPSQ